MAHEEIPQRNARSDFEELDARLRRIEEEVRFASQHGPQPPIFLARVGDSDLQWQEQTIVTVAGAPSVLDFIDGRKCDDDGQSCARVDLGEAQVFMEVLEGVATRYVRLTEGVGQYKYMIHQVVAQRVGGWNWGLAHPPQI